MAWAKLDDQFPSHPKMVMAGGDAGWLHVCALCYCAQHLTDGHVPKGYVTRLSDRKKPLELAARLVEVGAWIEHADTYELHDYLKFNPSREKVLAERDAAAARRANGGRASRERRPTVTNPDPLEPKGSTKTERDALFSALVDVFGPATTKQRQGHYGKCVTELLEILATPEQVRERGRRLLARGWDNPSPGALLKWWDDLAKDPAPTKPAEPEPVRPILGRGVDAEPVWDLDEHGNAVAV